jgi:FAD/FMN-containing dehydrogenase
MATTQAQALDYEARKNRLSEQMRRSGGGRLEKKTSNLFRTREKTEQARLNVRDFNHVLSVNTDEQWADAEGMTTYEDFVNETLKYGLMPAVVPQLKTITIGGAEAGVGIEATSFRYGFVHETVLEMEILLATGETVVCNKNKNSDLFYGFPNSYGTFGYALRLKVKLVPVKPFVKIEHARYSDSKSYFQALEKSCGSGADFVDGVIFSPTEMCITTGKFVDEAPFASDYTYLDIYYKSIQEKKIDYLSVRDFIWRWDTDWFWCSKNFGAQNRIVRMILGKKHLCSAVYWKIMNFAQKHRFITWLAHPLSRRESVIQDIDVPIENAPNFAAFFFREINVRPVWICPFRAYEKTAKFNFYSFNPEKFYVNFGFWDSVPTKKEDGYYNRMIEEKVSELQGKKGLYSDSFYSPEKFWNIYDKKTYDALKQKYDPQHKLKDLFEKCVRRR